jgi:hypothetical protein
VIYPKKGKYPGVEGSSSNCSLKHVEAKYFFTLTRLEMNHGLQNRHPEKEVGEIRSQ